MTIEGSARYYHIGKSKLQMLIDQNPHENFHVTNGNRVLIKRVKFERWPDQATAVWIQKKCTAKLPISYDTTVLRAGFVI